MKLSKIVKRVEEIRELAALPFHDEETLHGMEDALWRDVLHDFAMGKGTEAKAAAALETEAIEFTRYRA